MLLVGLDQFTSAFAVSLAIFLVALRKLQLANYIFSSQLQALLLNRLQSCIFDSTSFKTLFRNFQICFDINEQSLHLGELGGLSLGLRQLSIGSLELLLHALEFILELCLFFRKLRVEILYVGSLLLFSFPSEVLKLF